MRVDSNGSRDRERQLQELLASYYEGIEDGQTPDPRALIEGNPGLAVELAEFFAVQDHLHLLTAPIRDVVGTPDGSVHGPVPSAGDPEDPSPLHGRRSIGDYDLLGEIARGGMGIVYRARQRSLNRPVAVKVLRDGAFATPADARRFRNEAETVANLDHPNIVPIYEVGAEQGCSFFSMKLIEGGSLAVRSQEFTADARLAAWLMATVARAIHYAHGRGILHRDLKPSNILIDERGQPQVVDFGLARRIDGDSDLTATGMVLGTPSYMAPEQAGGRQESVTTAADVHGLGAVLYFMLTGRPPYGGATVLDILDRVRTGPPKTPSTIRRPVDHDLETICLKCLENDPARRYSSAEAVADDLERWLDGRSILARRVGRAERAWRLCRRHSRMAALAAVAIVLAATAAAGLIAGTRSHRAALLLDEEVRRKGLALRTEQYARDVQQAGHAWADNHLDRAREILDRLRPAPGETDLRGFAWHYFHRLCYAGRPPLVGHEREVYFAAFSPDGKFLATAGQDRTARLWDVRTGRPLATLTGHTYELNWVSISPDGRTLATAGDDQTVRLWDVRTERLKDTLTGHRDMVVAAIFSPDGRRVISCGRKGEVIAWDGAPLRECRRFTASIGDVQAMAISPDGAMLAIAADGTFIRSLADGRELARLEHHGGQARWAEFSPDGQAVVTAGRGDEIELWETRTWRRTDVFPTREAEVLSVRFSPDGRTLAAVGSHGRIHLIDRATGTKDLIATGQDYLWCGAYSPDGATLATASRDGTVKLWDLLRDRARIAIDVPTAAISSVGFSADGSSITVADDRGRFWIHEARGGGLIAAHLLGDGDRVRRAILASNARLMVTSGGSTTVTLWELPGGRRLGDYAFPNSADESLVVSPDGRWIAMTAPGGKVTLRDVAHHGEPKLLEIPEGGVSAISLRGDPLSILGWGMGRPQILDPVSGRMRDPTGTGHRDRIVCHAFSPDGSILATGGDGGMTILWDVASVRPVVHLSGPGTWVRSMAFTPNGRTLATGHDDGRVYLWDIATGRELATLEGHSGRVNQVGFSADGLIMATCAEVAGGRSELFLWPARPWE